MEHHSIRFRQGGALASERVLAPASHIFPGNTRLGESDRLLLIRANTLMCNFSVRPFPGPPRRPKSIPLSVARFRQAVAPSLSGAPLPDKNKTLFLVLNAMHVLFSRPRYLSSPSCAGVCPDLASRNIVGRIRDGAIAGQECYLRIVASKIATCKSLVAIIIDQ
ncbi:Hypothetical protein NTJ_06119 [Nesidiocoris tenuis]|uniref:Uncharacterized protein n=1 Tax=Nesidiocoris tenuis TaxID=355587 RepID=A0ABN7AM53_9HEMI|nr:Hypothetical protein NTJ_06119 [Nesidiocoris tenuis]